MGSLFISDLIIASLVQLTEMFLKKYDRKLHESLGIYLPLITTNCAVLGVCLLNINNDYSLIESLVFSLGSGIGFIFVSYIFASMRKRIDKAPVINCFKGYPIALITASIMVLLFARYI